MDGRSSAIIHAIPILLNLFFKLRSLGCFRDVSSAQERILFLRLSLLLLLSLYRHPLKLDSSLLILQMQSSLLMLLYVFLIVG